MSGLLRRWRASFGDRRPTRRERAGDTALAFAGSLVGLSGAGLSRGAAASARPTSLPAVDGPLLSVVLALLLIGTVMVYSASISLADSPRYNVAPTHFLMRHLLSLGIAFCVAAIAFQIPIGVWQRLAPFVFIGALTLLVVVLIPGVGKGVNGAKRWIPLGVLNLQPSELMKVACALYAANFTVRKQDTESLRQGFLPMVCNGCAIGCCFCLQPTCAFGLIVAISMGILFSRGVNGRLFTGINGRAASVFVLVIGCRRGGATVSLPISTLVQDNALGKAYQLSHSLIAFGRVEWFGRRPRRGVEKLHYLARSHTDFILAVLGEETRLAGVATVSCSFTGWSSAHLKSVARRSHSSARSRA